MKKLEDLIETIDGDIAWRKKEVSSIILMHNEKNSELIVKLSVLLLYSHWEGCVKNLCKLYLGYVSNLSIKLPELTDNFKAITLKGRLRKINESNNQLNIANELKFIRSIDEISEKRFKFKNKSGNGKNIINTKSNLKYEIFKSFIEILGIGEKSCLATKKIYIDEKLLNNRNKIAHGNKVNNCDDEFDLNIESIKSLKNLIFSILDSLASDLKSYAEEKYYLSSRKTETDKYDVLSNKDLESEIKNITI